MKNLINNILSFNNKQALSFSLDKMIEQIKKDGYICFFITINLASNILDDTEKFNLWKEYIKNFNSLIQKNVITWGFTFSTMEVNENNLMHTHIILGIKNLTNSPYNICLNIKELLRYLGYLDIKLNFLKDFINTKRAFIYIYKNSENGDTQFKHYVNFNINCQQTIACMLDELDSQKFESEIDGFTYFEHDLKFIQNNVVKKKIFDKIKLINGIIYKEKINEKELNFDFIINLYVFFFILNDIKEHNNNFIKKFEHTLRSFEFWETKKQLIKKWDIVIEFFLNFFKIYVENFNMYELKKSNVFLDNLAERITKINLLIDLKINVIFTLIEFKDGIYDLQKNAFFKKAQITPDKFQHIAILKYCNYTFKNLRTPNTWLESIAKVLNFDKVEIIELLTHLGIIFSNNYDILKKKRVLFILGESNTYKTTLIANIFIEYFGIDNIALMTQSKNFPFQNFNKKLIAVLDEFKYYSSLHTEYLKIFENRDAIVEKKFEDAIVINPLHVIILSNENFIANQNDLIKQQALKNRISMFIFNKNEDNVVDYNKVKKENIEIVVFLCKFYNEINKNDQDKRKKKIKNKLTKLLKQ